jgi:threonine dehydrogenase-like Zn-dependent dehydrogenase
VRALVYERSLPRFAAAKVVGALAPGRGATVGPLRLADVDPPELPGPGWVRVRPRLAGICGSDLATVDGRTSRYFEPLVSFPFTPGHEVVGELDDGSRVVLEPVLACGPRGIDPPCRQCAAGRTQLCERQSFGALEPGLQTGYCADTGGGWGTWLVAHESQLHRVPDDLSDEAAVLVEPTACAVHAARSVPPGDAVAVVGAGTLGLCTIAALAALPRRPELLLATAKHPEQRALARSLGADVVVEPAELARAVRRATGSLRAGAQLTGGVPAVVDCVGSEESVASSLSVVAPGGTVVLLGMPGRVSVDLTPLWHREVRLVGSYAYGEEDGGRTFDLAFDLVRAAGLDRLLSATYPLDRYEEALAHAAEAGRRGAVKIAFDLRGERRR